MSASGDGTSVTPPAPSRGRSGRALRARWPLVFVAVWACVAVIDLVFFHVGTGSGRPVAASEHRPGVAAHRHAVGRTGPPQPVPTATHKPAAAPVLLTPASAAAFGPTGYSSGDNNWAAPLAIDDSSATAWKTAWYRSASFGNLQAGSGLLIDMGRSVRITSVRLLLQAAPGADVQLYTGNEPVRADMRVSATAYHADGQLPLSLVAPRRARYLLIWFTLLPRDSSGTYQASVYDVTIFGTR
jgi:hypothetical protein